MENLTKQQLVLLALLLSFVTSIATGIVTVSLMEQEPQGVTQTINRVVERTIEKVIQAPSQGAAVVTKETVVVKSDDATVQAIEKNNKSIVRIYESVLGEGDVAPHDIFAGIGFVVTKDGLVVTDSSVSSGNGDYFGFFADGKKLPLKLASVGDNLSAIVFKALVSGKEEYAFSPVTLTDSNLVKLGQTVIALGGRDKNVVSIGIISSFVTADKGVGTTTPVEISVITNIETNILAKGLSIGGPLLNLYGEVVGLDQTGGPSEKALYLPANSIKTEIAAAIEALSKESANAAAAKKK